MKGVETILLFKLLAEIFAPSIWTESLNCLSHPISNMCFSTSHLLFVSACQVWKPVCASSPFDSYVNVSAVFSTCKQYSADSYEKKERRVREQ